MAERRNPRLESTTAVRDLTRLFDGAGPPSAWFVQDADDSVIQPFYAALDGEQRLCWTDDRDRAQRFETKQDAERFAVDRVTTEICIVPAH